MVIVHVVHGYGATYYYGIGFEGKIFRWIGVNGMKMRGEDWELCIEVPHVGW